MNTPQSSPYSEIWEALATAALLGTERRPFELPPPGDNSLGAMLANLHQASATNPEHTLLSAVAALTLYRRAGSLPTNDPSPLPGSCLPETLASCSPRTASHLHTMLAGEYSAALSEWLEEAARRGKFVPPDQLPLLLSIGQTQPGYRQYILPVIGNRGRWLASMYTLNDQWAYVRDSATLEAPDEDSTRDVWETGSQQARQALLQNLRASQPDHARRMLKSVWQQESAPSRAAFLQVLRTGLTIADEPFLESALDDQGKDVRATAADLLANLPGSRFMRRMIDGVAPLLSLKRGKQGKLFGATNKLTIEVATTQEYTPAMKRDSIEQKPGTGNFGERTYWLLQQLSRIPPRTWVERWEAPTQEIIAAAFQTKEWKNLLIQAWILATVRHNDQAWADAFLSYGLAKLSEYAPDSLVRILPAERRDDLVKTTLNAHPEALYTDDMPLSILWTLRKPWPDEVCRAVLTSMSHHIKASPRQGNWQVSQSIATFAYSMTPDILPEAESILTTTDQTPKNLKEAVDDFRQTLQFRKDMLQALSE